MPLSAFGTERTYQRFQKVKPRGDPRFHLQQSEREKVSMETFLKVFIASQFSRDFHRIAVITKNSSCR
jgi:hypothetical protein